MHVISVRNVNDALIDGIQLIKKEGVKISPRGKDTLEVPEPVTTIYTRPEERVLFSGVRDANPFFHFFESLWMLAGRGDVEFPAHFNKRMKEFSDNGVDLWGAYGWRWRSFFGFDQLQGLVELLRRDSDSRRGVVTMWSPPGDLLPGGAVAGGTGRDVPCNTQLYFKIRAGRLRMTICNRSNDMVWGAYGANAVHMSILQEYLADKLGVELGAMYQISDSYHVYLDGPGGELWQKLVKDEEKGNHYNLYLGGKLEPFPLCANNTNWDEDLQFLFEQFDADKGAKLNGNSFSTPFFRTVVLPLWLGWQTRDLTIINSCAAPDWRQACLEWVLRRS